MSITLFYGGLGCVVIGAAGLITLLVLFLRNRRVDQRDHLIEEIELAENRAPAGPPRHQQPTPQRPAAPQTQQNPVQPKPAQAKPAQKQSASGTGPIVPEEASLYTEEFTLPEIPKPQAQRPAPQPPKAPDPAKQFDTDEILREVLRQTTDNNNNNN